MAERRRRDLAPEVIDELNMELDELRGLYVPERETMASIKKAARRASKDFRTALATGEVKERDPADKDVLAAVAASFPATMEQAASYGAKSTSFMEKLHGLVVTRRDGTTITDSINPDDVDRDGPATYFGDDRDLPRVYVESNRVRGRIVGDAEGISYDINRDGVGYKELGVLLWPDDVKKWNGLAYNGPSGAMHHGTTTSLGLLDESVRFVEHVGDCKLPDPEEYSRNIFYAASL